MAPPKGRLFRRAGRWPCRRHEAVTSLVQLGKDQSVMVAGVAPCSLSPRHDNNRMAWPGVVAFQHDTLHTRRHTTHPTPAFSACAAALAACCVPGPHSRTRITFEARSVSVVLCRPHSPLP